jgi:uncharacterized protein (TIGR00255 family)
VPLALLASIPGAFVTTDVELEPLHGALDAAVGAALDALEADRAREGEALRRDLIERATRIEAIVASLSERLPAAMQDHRARVRARIEQLTSGIALDEARLVGELAMAAQRADVTEELVRLGAHRDVLVSTLAAGAPANFVGDPADVAARTKTGEGRRLEFVLQEMLREATTMGSKSTDAVISCLVVELKAELERVREQVQNVE